MKKTSIFTLLMLAFGVIANAQSRLSLNIPQLYDGMDSIVVTYNPFGTGGDATDTIFQTFTGALFMYIYTTDSTAGSPGHNNYADGKWGDIDTIATCALTRVSASSWVMTMPNMRSFLQCYAGSTYGAGVPKDDYVTGLNFIVHDSGSTTIQSANMYAPVSESYALEGFYGEPISTGPVTDVATSTYVASGDENVVIYYHPQQDTFAHSGQAGDTAFKTTDSTLYVWAWAQASNGVQYNFTPAGWGAVGATPADVMVEIDSNNYAWDIRSLEADFISAGMPTGVTIDSIGFIPRTSGDGSASVAQTRNFYVPLISSTTGVANVNTNAATASLYPNPATDAVFVNYTFAQPGNGKVVINNLIGQTVMTQDLGQNQKGNMYLSVNNLPSGVYLVTVTNGTSTSVQRFVKQ